MGRRRINKPKEREVTSIKQNKPKRSNKSAVLNNVRKHRVDTFIRVNSSPAYQWNRYQRITSGSEGR